LSFLKDIQKRVFELKSGTNDADFNLVALEVFNYQHKHNTIYKAYILSLKIEVTDVKHYTQIPFLPIEFFKSQQVVCNRINADSACFSSSGTTGQTTSKHYVNDIAVYEKSFNKGFELFYGNPKDYCILALLPNYLERTGSSLVYMFDKLIQASSHPQSGFYLNNLEELKATIELLKQRKQKTILLGVTYALLDLAEMEVELTDDFIVMETGGMKGRRKEMLKEELHQTLKQGLNVNAVHSEYGMTELLSQAYSKQNGVFECPPWMKILIRDVNDPFSYVKSQKSGGVNVIDLANINSCSFIETKDLGKITQDSYFEILGRFDNSDLRGCNLMIQ
jgi:phenylacetate-coenzyme A ligase PaaK-like adenylate-forming protein